MYGYGFKYRGGGNGSLGGAVYSNTKSLLLDGIDEAVNINGVSTSLSGTTQGAFSCWIKAVDATPVSNEEIITFGDTNATVYLRFMFISSTGRLTASLSTGSEVWRVDLDGALSNATWYHLVLTHNGTEASIYVDGVKPAQAFSTSTDKTAWFNDIPGVDNGRIGCLNFNSAGNSNFFNGNIDEVTFYNANLSGADITDIYNSGCPKNESARSGLVSYYRMGDGSGDNWNSGVANEWQFIDQKGSNNAQTINCEEADVELDTPC